MIRKLSIAGALIVTMGWSGAALAFPWPDLFHEPASGQAGNNRAGAGGIYGTGGKQDYGIKCSHCHIDPDGAIDVNVVVTKGSAGSPTGWDDVGGLDGYQPGATYTIRVELVGEHKTSSNGGNRTDQNGFSATFETQGGQLAGTLMSDSGESSDSCPASYPYGTNRAGNGGTTVLFGDCHGVLFFAGAARTSWTFSWKAPDAGTGEVTFYLGMVDGNSKSSSSLDDDVTEKSFSLVEGP